MPSKDTYKKLTQLSTLGLLLLSVRPNKKFGQDPNAKPLILDLSTLLAAAFPWFFKEQNEILCAGSYVSLGLVILDKILP